MSNAEVMQVISELRARVADLESKLERHVASGQENDNRAAAIDNQHDVDYTPLHADVPPTLEEDVLETSDSLFNYCMETLTFSKQPHTEMAWLYLCLACILQQGLIMTVLQSNEMGLSDMYILGNERQPWSLLEGCRREEGKYAKDPDGDLLVRSITAMLGMIIVSLFINADMHSAMEVSFPGPDAPMLVRGATVCFWFLQTVMLPCNIIMEIARLFALSGSPMDIVMNTLAATFILEIDELLFVTILTNRQKQGYYALSERQKASSKSSGSGPIVGWIRFVGMLFQYFWIRHTAFPHDSMMDVTGEIVHTCYAYLVLYFVEVFAQSYKSVALGQKALGTLWATGCGILSAICGFLYWVSLSSLGENTFEMANHQEKAVFACVQKHASAYQNGGW